MALDPFKPAFTAKPAPIQKPRRSVAETFRELIEKCEADGVDRAEMTMRLTRGDEAELRRDNAVALEDIRYSDGVMRYLQVRVATSREPVSKLDTLPDPIPEPVVAPVKKTRAKAKPKVAKVAKVEAAEAQEPAAEALEEAS